MKVLVLSHMYPSTFDELNGIFVHEQVKALTQQGIDIRVVSPVPWVPSSLSQMNPKWKRYSQVPLRDSRDGIVVDHPRYLAFPRGLFFAASGHRMYCGIRAVVDQIYRNFPFDVIHAHVALPDGFAGMQLAKRHDKPFVVTIHGQDLQVTLHKNQQCKQALTSVFACADRVIVVSTKLKRIAQTEIGYSDRIVTINNGIDPKILSRGVDATRDRNGSKTILSVSNLVSSKGIDLNLMAIARLLEKHPRLRYLVIGDGSSRESLVRLTHDLDLMDHVEFLGRLPQNQVMESMAETDIFSLPSWREGFGVVYLEAMAHGKPVIACRGEGIEDVLTHGETGLLVKPKDVDSLVEALDSLLSHPERAKAMGEIARKHVLKNYTWEKNAEKTITVYEEVLNAD